jgi:hypothetical protein
MSHWYLPTFAEPDARTNLRVGLARCPFTASARLVAPVASNPSPATRRTLRIWAITTSSQLTLRTSGARRLLTGQTSRWDSPRMQRGRRRRRPGSSCKCMPMLLAPDPVRSLTRNALSPVAAGKILIRTPESALPIGVLRCQLRLDFVYVHRKLLRVVGRTLQRCEPAPSDRTQRDARRKHGFGPCVALPVFAPRYKRGTYGSESGWETPRKNAAAPARTKTATATSVAFRSKSRARDW